MKETCFRKSCLVLHRWAGLELSGHRRAIGNAGRQRVHRCGVLGLQPGPRAPGSLVEVLVEEREQRELRVLHRWG